MNKKGESIMYYFKHLTKPSGRRGQKKDTLKNLIMAPRVIQEIFKS